MNMSFLPGNSQPFDDESTRRLPLTAKLLELGPTVHTVTPPTEEEAQRELSMH